MAESDSQGEDLPPFTPLGQDKPQDLEDLPEYTPFADPQKGKVPAADNTAESPSMPVLQEAVSEEVLVEDVLQSGYVQETVVAAEGPGDVPLKSLVPGETQAEIAPKDSEWEIIEPEESSETTVAMENISEKVTFTPVEEQKLQLEEEKPQEDKAKGKKKRGGKGKISDTPTTDLQSETSDRQEVSQPVSVEKDEIATEVPKAELVQKPVEKTLEREEEAKAVPREPQADDWSFDQDLKDMSSEKKPTMQGNNSRKKVKSGRPAKPITEEVKAPMQEETKESAPYEEPEKPIPQGNQILQSEKPAAALPVEEVQSEPHQAPSNPTVSEEKAVEKPKQQPAQAKGKWKPKEAKPQVIASPEVPITKPSLPEEIKEIPSAQPASEEPTVEITPKQPTMQPKRKQKQRSGKPAAAPLLEEDTQAPVQDVTLEPSISTATVDKGEEMPKPVAQAKDQLKPTDTKSLPAAPLVKPPVPEESKEGPSVPAQSEEIYESEKPKQPTMQPKRKQKQRSGKPAAAPLLEEDTQAPVQDVTPEPSISTTTVGEEIPKPVAQAKDQLKPMDSKSLPTAPLVKPSVPEESKEGPSAPVQSEETKEGEKPKQPKTQTKGKQKQSSEKPAAVSLPTEKTPVQDSIHEPQKPTVSEDIVEEKPKQPPPQAKGKGKQKNIIPPVAAQTEVPPAKPALAEETKEIPPISAASEEPIGEVKSKQPTMQAKGRQQKQRSGKPAATLPEEAPLTTTRETPPVPPPAEVKNIPKGAEPQTEKPKQSQAPKEPSKPVVPQPVSERKPTEEQKKAAPESMPQAAKSSGWKKIVKESLALEPKEPLQPVISPIQPPVEETKKPVLQAKVQNKTRSGKPVTQPTSQEESKAVEAPRQGLSAQARKKQNDRRTDRGPKPVAPATVEVPKPTGPKPVKDPQVIELERQVHLTKEKQKNAKLFTAKLQKTIEESNAKKERVERQIAKARQTLTQLTEELSESKVPYTETKEEALLKQLKARVRVLAEDLTAKETDFAALRSLKEAKAKEARGLEARHQQLEDQKRKLIAEHSEAVSESESYHSEIKRLEGLIKRANVEIEDMKGSFSSLDLDSELKDWETKRTVKARELGEEEGRVHASLSMLETERLAYYPEQAVNTICSGKLAKELEELDAKLREKTGEVSNLRGELEEGQAGCCPLIFLLIGILLGVLVQLLVRY